MKHIINRILGQLGYSVIRNSKLASLSAAAAHGRSWDFLAEVTSAQLAELVRLNPLSQAQLKQDLFVLSELGLKRGGFFVEFGAASGKELSNTWLLEKHFGWSGILAEPARCWHERLAANRSCIIDHDCVWRSTGAQLGFLEAAQPELATLDGFQHVNLSEKASAAAVRYQVKTVSLADLLVRHHAPAELDYLSIDTEGSEYEILSNFDFSKYSISAITCEHNYTPMRQKIYSLLTKQGYKRVYEEISFWDDWYIKN